LLLAALGILVVACTTTTFVPSSKPAPASTLGDPAAEDGSSEEAPSSGPDAPGAPAANDGGTTGRKDASPGCVPTTCEAKGKTCGTLPDGCGGTLDCGDPACDDGNLCTDDACTSGVCRHTARADGSACGASVQACQKGLCLTPKAYCVDTEPNDFWNGTKFTGNGYTSISVTYCSCEGNVLHAPFDTTFGGTQDLANITCASCAKKTVSGYEITTCF